MKKQDLERTIIELNAAYEKALYVEDIEQLNAFFCDSDKTMRIGIQDEQIGIESIRKFRKKQMTKDSEVSAQRKILSQQVDILSEIVGVIHSVFEEAQGRRLRQSQVWFFTQEKEWKIRAAHVSFSE